MTNEQLINEAIKVLNPRILSRSGAEAGGVGCALITDKGNIYTGVCIEGVSSLAFCAEHVALGNMITHGETRVDTIVAVDWDKTILPPCGVCREYLYMIDDNNGDTNVILPGNEIMKLRDLLPHHWMAKKVA